MEIGTKFDIELVVYMDRRLGKVEDAVLEKILTALVSEFEATRKERQRQGHRRNWKR